MPEGIYVRRALSAVPRRRRCQVCRARMAMRTYGPYSRRAPGRSYRYLDGVPEQLAYRRLRWVDYLCAECGARNGAAREDVFRTLDRRLAATVRRYAAWLAAAPPLRRRVDKLPPRLRPYYEVCGIDVAADEIARRLRRYERIWLGREDERSPREALRLNDDHPLAPFSPDRAPGSYKDTVSKSVLDEDGSMLWTGSVFRADGGSIVVHWHTDQRLSFG